MKQLTLADATIRKKYRIQEFVKEKPCPQIQRLGELGFIPGEAVEVRHVGPVGSDPIAAFIRGSLIALRRKEAQYILIKETKEA